MTKYFILHKLYGGTYTIYFRELPTDDIEEAYGTFFDQLKDETIIKVADDLLHNGDFDFEDIEDARDYACDAVSGEWWQNMDFSVNKGEGVLNSIYHEFNNGLFIINSRNKLWSQLGVKELETVVKMIRDDKPIREHITDVILDNIRKYYDV